MAKLSLAWFGSGSVHIGDQPVRFRTRKAEALLVYLTTEAALHNGAPMRREALLGLLWPDYPEKSARQSLRTNLSYLRTALSGMEESEGINLFLAGNSQVVEINLDAGVVLDVFRFTRLQAEVAAHGHEALLSCAVCRQRLERTADLYAGDFLEGFYVPDSSDFETWASARRELFRRQVLGALEDLTAICIAQADLEAAEANARRQLAMDPLRESAHRQLMTALARVGQRPAAISHYENLQRLLREELGIAPSSATRVLYDAIMEGELVSVESASTPGPSLVEDESSKFHAETVPTVPHNLRPPPTPFVGRQEEVDHLTALLVDPKIRLVTIAGAGGMGKTRLAIATAERLVVDPPGHALFPNGIYFVALAPLSEASHIVQAIAEALHVHLRLSGGDTGAIGPLIGRLRRKQLLLVLDNFEHLLEGAALVAEIIQAAPGVKIIVTSRERLRLQEEQVFPIDGLGVPESMFSEKLMEYAAVALFLQTARRVQPDFDPDRSETAILVDICRRLEGVPLGIELAAGWVDTLPLTDISAELQSSMDLLETEMRNVPARHRSMRAIFDSSWGQLSEQEQAVLGRLCTVRGGFMRQTAQQVAGATVPILSRLVNKSLLQFQPVERRYHVHELMRQYSLERMAAKGELDLARDAHSEYFLNFVRQREEAMKGRRQIAALREISIEFENVRSAWIWAAQRKNYEAIGGALDSLLMGYCDRMQRFVAGIDLRQKALALLSPLANEEPHPVWYRLTARHLAPREKEKPQLEKALAFAYKQGDQSEIAFCTAQLGWARVMTGDYKSGIPQLQEGIRLFRQLGDQSSCALWLHLLGIAYQHTGRTEEALAAFQESLALHREFNDLAYAASTLHSLTWFLRLVGRFAESEVRLRELIAIRKEIGVPEWVAYGQLDLAFATFLRGEFKEFDSLVQQASQVSIEAGDSEAKFELGVLANLQGHHQKAWQLHESLTEIGILYRGEFYAAWGLSLAACCLGRYEIAGKQLKSALETAITTHGKGHIALALPVLALLLAKLDRTERAVELLALGQRHLVDATGWLENWSLFVQLKGDMQAALGRSAFAAAWQRGQNLDLWQTVDQLLRELTPAET